MVRFVGLDVHKRQVEVCILDAKGRDLLYEKVACTREALEEFARRRLQRGDHVALEATTNTWAVVEILEPRAASVTVSNPLKTRAIAEAHVKTDKIDAQVLAQLLRCGYLPGVWIPDAATRRLRRLVSRRAALVSDRTTIKNRIHSVLHQRLLHPPMADLFATQGLAWLRSLELDPEGRSLIDSDLRLLGAVEQELERLGETLAREAHPDARVRLMMTLPGVDYPVAQAVLARWGDLRRFRSPDHAVAYLGLAPRTKQSAQRCYHGPITKAGDGKARWMLVQAAQHLAAHPGPLGHSFRKLLRRKNRNVAVVACARKMARILFLMLQNNEPYRYAKPQSTSAKLAKLRIRATGKRRRGGVPKGTPRTAAYGSSERTRGISSLQEVYRREDVPAPKLLAPGELRIVGQADALSFLEEIGRPRRVPRPPSRPNSKTSASPSR